MLKNAPPNPIFSVGPGQGQYKKWQYNTMRLQTFTKNAHAMRLHSRTSPCVKFVQSGQHNRYGRPMSPVKGYSIREFAHIKKGDAK